MNNEQLNGYIRQQREAGFSSEAIKKALMDAGWDETLVDSSMQGSPQPLKESGPPTVSSSNHTNVQNPGKSIFVALSAILAVVLIGVGGVFAYNKLAAPKPEEVIDKMMAAMTETRPSSFVFELNYKGVGSIFTAAMIAIENQKEDTESFGDFPAELVDKDTEQTSGVVTDFNMRLTGKSDLRDLNNPKSDLVATVELKTPLKFGPAEVVYRTLNKKNYVKFGKLPPLGFLDLSKIEGKWIVFDPKEVKDEFFASPFANVEDDGESEKDKLTKEQESKLRKLFLNKELLKVNKVLPSETVSGVKTHHYSYTVDKSKLIAALFEADEITKAEQKEPETTASPFELMSLGARDNADYIAALEDVIQSVSGELWIGKKDNYLYKSSVVLHIKGYGAEAEIKLVLQNNNFNQPVQVDVPEGAKTFDEVLDEVMGRSGLKARDSKRLSDLRQMQTALELFYTDNNAYPIQEVGLRLGSDDAGCLNKDGWQAKSSCPLPYMGTVPQDPAEDQYYQYTSTDGLSYELTALLEGEVNGLTGKITATPAGIYDEGGEPPAELFGGN